ncbi:MAG: hypothetical protein QNK37_28575 [Acidobacteriota bacterium]|nr:hypothetical protein [Acidobacteriota bacterium]
MTQFYTDDTGQRFLPVLSPFQQGPGIGSFGADRRRNIGVDIEEEPLEFQDVIELDREIGGFRTRDSEFSPREFQENLIGFGRDPFFNGSNPGGFSASNGNFSVDRDVVANIYAANEAISAAPINPGGNLNLVA